MSYYVYMLKSKTVKPVTYVGYTSDLKKRIKLHILEKGPNLREAEPGN